MIPQLISADIGKGKIIFAATLEWHLPIKYNTLVTKKKTSITITGFGFSRGCKHRWTYKHHELAQCFQNVA